MGGVGVVGIQAGSGEHVAGVMQFGVGAVGVACWKVVGVTRSDGLRRGVLQGVPESADECGRAVRKVRTSTALYGGRGEMRRCESGGGSF